MKAVTGNRLADGRVVYLADNDQWSDNMSDAARFTDEDSADVLAAAATRASEVADVYLIDVDDAGAPAGRAAVRETVRMLGPTVRPDLGYQAVKA